MTTTTKVESRKAKVENEHTPGPWRNNGGQIESVEGWGPIEALGGLLAPHCRVVATVGRVNEQSYQDTANARLIAAAPDLLAALKTMPDPYAENQAFLDWFEDVSTAAIAKAEGR